MDDISPDQLQYIDDLLDRATLSLLESGGAECGDHAPEGRACARQWGHDGEHAYLKYATIDHIDLQRADTPLCMDSGEGGHCLLSHTHEGPHERMELAEADRRWGVEQGRDA